MRGARCARGPCPCCKCQLSIRPCQTWAWAAASGCSDATQTSSCGPPISPLYTNDQTSSPPRIGPPASPSFMLNSMLRTGGRRCIVYFTMRVDCHKFLLALEAVNRVRLHVLVGARYTIVYFARPSRPPCSILAEALQRLLRWMTKPAVTTATTSCFRHAPSDNDTEETCTPGHGPTSALQHAGRPTPSI